MMQRCGNFSTYSRARINFNINKIINVKNSNLQIGIGTELAILCQISNPIP